MSKVRFFLPILLIALVSLWLTGVVTPSYENKGKIISQDIKGDSWTIAAPRYDYPEYSLYPDPTITITPFFYDTYLELNEVYHEKGGEVELVQAFSHQISRTECEVHVMMPTDWNDKNALQSLGHETLHCFGADHNLGEVI